MPRETKNGWDIQPHFQSPIFHKTTVQLKKKSSLYYSTFRPVSIL